MSENTTVYVCQTCGELVPLGCCTCGPRQQLRAIGDEGSKMSETEMIEQALTIVLDEFDFARVARYMRRTDWLVENLHDGAQSGEHNWIYPGAKWLREHVERVTRRRIIEDSFPDWTGWFGFNVYLAAREGNYRLFIRFTDTRPIVVTSHQEVKEQDE